MDDDEPRDLELDWSVEEIIDALSGELAFLLDKANAEADSDAEAAVIEKAFKQMGDDDDSTEVWLRDAKHRRRVVTAARRKLAKGDW